MHDLTGWTRHVGDPGTRAVPASIAARTLRYAQNVTRRYRYLDLLTLGFVGGADDFKFGGAQDLPGWVASAQRGGVPVSADI